MTLPRVFQLLQDSLLIIGVLCLVLIDTIVVTTWVTLDPMYRHLQSMREELSADRRTIYIPQVEHCKSEKMPIWLLTLCGYKGLLLIVGVYMAWETRSVLTI